MTANKGSGPQFGEMVYIAEVNRAMKVKSDTQVAISKYSDQVQNFFHSGSWGGQCPELKFFQTSQIVQNESS